MIVCFVGAVLVVGHGRDARSNGTRRWVSGDWWVGVEGDVSFVREDDTLRVDAT